MSDASALAVPRRLPAPAMRYPAEALLSRLAAAGLVVTVVAGASFLTAVAAIPPDRSEQMNSSVAREPAHCRHGRACPGRDLPGPAAAPLGHCLVDTRHGAGLVVQQPLRGRGYLPPRGDSTLAPAVGWVTNSAWVPAHVLAMLMPLRFPTGRLPRPRWRVAELAVLAWGGLTWLTTALLPGPLGADVLAPMTNPLGWDRLDGVADALLSVLFALLPALVLVAAAAPVVRWRRAGGPGARGPALDRDGGRARADTRGASAPSPGRSGASSAATNVTMSP